GWREVTVKEDNTTIKFDLNTYGEIKEFCHHLLDTAFAEMEMDEIIAYLTENSYSDEIIERYEEEKSEAA
ncbi:hypothetical protein DT177_23900, partial [Salmonella enterica subsp. enterica serovar Braenderup]|nr:hypothetical protein [Salmonella enterica subsp. enterica serovar Braenderup]ECE9039641.1 hypothetical protein [Salmonella enterica subsp. enterica serovar Braenderup]MKC96373.1 hypothetical protein [Salmonella enterica subsp. enterica serovar Braenderup]